MVWKRCKAKIKTQEGNIIQCQYHSDNNGQHEGDHHFDGYIWRDEQELPRAFRIAGLWLTSGGRIVKPGAGESCIDSGDVQLMSSYEIQNGIFLDEFQKRLNKAIKKQQKRYKF